MSLTAAAGTTSGSPPRGWGKHLTPPLRDYKCTVHPHAGGENAIVGIHGSLVPRFTPTRVGKTWGSGIGRTRGTVHPHAGGENIHSPGKLEAVIGSPPRGWGKLAALWQERHQSRFTPTRVGKTHLRALARGGETVHPHAGGENITLDGRATPVFGSPPRGWGKLHTHRGRRVGVRFTPTRVGKTGHAHADRELSGGSPPRGWGKLAFRRNLRGCHRFTPTRVGKTRPLHHQRRCRVGSPPRGWGKLGGVLRRAVIYPVHPHAGGENAAGVDQLANRNGSPPRGWGKPAQPAVLAYSKRFTPTRVGKTRMTWARARPTTVHPHAGGENVP